MIPAKLGGRNRRMFLPASPASCSSLCRAISGELPDFHITFPSGRDVTFLAHRKQSIYMPTSFGTKLMRQTWGRRARCPILAYFARVGHDAAGPMPPRFANWTCPSASFRRQKHSRVLMGNRHQRGGFQSKGQFGQFSAALGGLLLFADRLWVDGLLRNGHGSAAGCPILAFFARVGTTVACAGVFRFQLSHTSTVSCAAVSPASARGRVRLRRCGSGLFWS